MSAGVECDENELDDAFAFTIHLIERILEKYHSISIIIMNNVMFSS